MSHKKPGPGNVDNIVRQNRRKLHISRYFFASVFLIVALLIIIPFITVYLLLQAYDEQIRSETRQASVSIQQTVRSFVGGTYNLCYELSLNRNTLDVTEAGISPILASAVERNEFLELLYITDAAESSDNYGWQVARSAGNLGDRSSRWWFLQITETRQPFVGRSYISIATGMPCTAVFIPMYDDSGTMTHVFGADISLAYIQGLVDLFANRNGGRFSFIIDGEGGVIAHPDNIYLETLTNYKTLTRIVPVTDAYGNTPLNPDGSIVTAEEEIRISDGFRAVISAVMAGNSGLEIVVEDGKTYYLSYESIPLPGYSDSWSVITLQNRSAAMSVVYTLTAQIAFITILIIALLSALIAGFFKVLHRTMSYLESALLQAETANRAKSDFLSTMSHEMRTPMSAIIGMTAIGKKTNSIEEKKHALNKIGDAASHLLGVINDVLDMAKIEANKLELAPIEYNFEMMLQKVISVVNFRMDEKKQTFSIDVDNKIPRFVVGDAQRLAQIVTNLMSNATKFTPTGGKIHLEASLIDEIDGDCELRISVADNGIGISPRQQEKLFQAFEQAESGTSREYGGTGLGLAISKRIIELMGGRIWIESELGKGAKVIFTIKVLRGNKNPSSLLAPGVNWEAVRILAVDDMPEVREQFQDMFSQLTIKCDTASDGLDAWRMVEERGGYDIYFIDWHMPYMDGIELTRQIKSRGDARSSAVIMITAMDWEQIKDEASAAGVDRHLIKPFFSSAVIDCINDCLDARHVKAEDIGEFAGKKMLLAEDVAINREIFTTLLKNTGLIIDCAENGQEALDMVTAAPDKYDIVFMDVQMPKMGGHEASRRIRALPALQEIRLPIIALTANIFKSDIEACLAAGMDNHLGKPIDVDRLLEILRKYLKANG